MFKNPFTDTELQRRAELVRKEISKREIDFAVFAAPESVFYLIGLDHWGYFAPTYLIVPLEGEMILVTRSMESVVIENQVRNARFIGHSDSETAVETLINCFTPTAGKPPEISIPKGGKLRIGIEENTQGHTAWAGNVIRRNLRDAHILDISGLCDRLRWIKSTEEQNLMRATGKISVAGMEAAIDAIHDGAREVDVAAECHAALIRAGSNPPGFGPFIRPDSRIDEEHTTWGDGIYRQGERVMLELTGCVARYHAPMGRLVHIGEIRDEDAKIAETAKDSFQAILDGLKPGVKAKDVYKGWQDVVSSQGLPNYSRHHCGYFIGIAFPPTWSGGNKVTGLRFDSELPIEKGMTFHAMSWFTNTGAGEYFISNCVLLGPDGPEVLTESPMGPIIK